MLEAFKKIYRPLRMRFGRPYGDSTLSIGLDIGSRFIKMVKLKQRHSSAGCIVDLRVQEIGSQILSQEALTRHQGMVRTLMSLVEEADIKGSKVAVSISGPSVILKSIEMPWMSEEELQGHLELEVERYLPYERGDIYWDYHVSHQPKFNDSSSMFVNLVAARKHVVDEQVALVKECGLRPVIVDVDSLALANMFAVNYPGSTSETVLLVNVGASGLNMITVGSTGYVVMRDVDLLGEWSYEVLHEASQGSRNGQNVMDSAAPQDKALSVLLDDVFREIVREIRRVIDDYQGYEHDQNIRQVWLCGGCAKVPGLVDSLSAQISLPVDIIDPFNQFILAQGLEQNTELVSHSSLVGVAVGLVLRGSQSHV